jgi:hypothetical protein
MMHLQQKVPNLWSKIAHNASQKSSTFVFHPSECDPIIQKQYKVYSENVEVQDENHYLDGVELVVKEAVFDNGEFDGNEEG